MSLITRNGHSKEFTLGFIDPITQIFLEKMIDKTDLLNVTNDENCFTGDVKYGLNLSDYTYSYMKGHLWVDSLTSLLSYILQIDSKLKF